MVKMVTKVSDIYAHVCAHYLFRYNLLYLGVYLGVYMSYVWGIFMHLCTMLS